jgi:hypothetical protein
VISWFQICISNANLCRYGEGFESDPRVHLEAVSKAIDRAYRKMRYSKYAKMDDRWGPCAS